jgi:hypothetical protein
MAKTHRKNPHSEEPTRRSNRTAGKSPGSVELPARKPAAARKTTSARKDTASRKDTAASPSVDSEFSGERKGPSEGIVPALPEATTIVPPSGDSEFSGKRKGPPEGIVPAPPEATTIVPRLPTLWEWTPPSGDVFIPVQPYFKPIVPMPTLVGIDFAAAQHDVTTD